MAKVNKNPFFFYRQLTLKKKINLTFIDNLTKKNLKITKRKEKLSHVPETSID
jgi:hypothetical protein